MATLKCPGLGAVGFVIFTFDDYAPVAEMARLRDYAVCVGGCKWLLLRPAG